MTLSDVGREPSDIETLLPWYAAGTLRQRDRQRVEEALRRDPRLARKLDLVREELAETIHLNESLGAPSPHVADRLMATIDAETNAAGRRAPGAPTNWLIGFFASLSPRTMAVASSFAMVAIALQSVILLDVFTKPSNTVVTRGLGSEERGGAFAMVRFAREASVAEITNFLQSYQAALVDGPTAGGLYRVRVAVKTLTRDELRRIVQQMRDERVVASAEPSE